MKCSNLFLVYVALVSLLASTIGVALLPSTGELKPLIGLAIAGLKAGLILMFFMELRQRSGLVRLFAAAGVFWLLLMFVLISGDYLTRQWI